MSGFKLEDDGTFSTVDRDAIIEECARQIAHLEHQGGGMFGDQYNLALTDAIAAIRTLKDKP